MINKKTFTVQNLKCGGCGKSIKNKLSQINSEYTIVVEPELNLVTIESKETIDETIIVEKLAILGYPINDNKNTIVSKAKSFISCAKGRLK